MSLKHRLARHYNYELIKRKHNPTLEILIVNLTSRFGIDLVFDVGANRGQYASSLRECGYTGEIYSFEPISSVFRELSRNADDDPLWSVFQYAFSDECGKATINVAATTELSSFLSPSALGHSKYGQHTTLASQETVEVVTFDHFLEDKVADWKTRRVFLKLDTQGYDLRVFAGASQRLDHIIAMQSEVSFEAIYENMPNHHEVISCYEAAGFQVAGFYPVTRNDDTWGMVEMDCVLINLNAPKQ